MGKEKAKNYVGTISILLDLDNLYIEKCFMGLCPNY